MSSAPRSADPRTQYANLLNPMTAVKWDEHDARNIHAVNANYLETLVNSRAKSRAGVASQQQNIPLVAVPLGLAGVLSPVFDAKM